jgi:hypothetical protein
MRVNKATYVPNHALHLRVKPALFAWLMSRAEEQALPVIAREYNSSCP